MILATVALRSNINFLKAPSGSVLKHELCFNILFLIYTLPVFILLIEKKKKKEKKKEEEKSNKKSKQTNKKYHSNDAQ